MSDVTPIATHAVTPVQRTLAALCTLSGAATLSWPVLVRARDGVAVDVPRAVAASTPAAAVEFFAANVPPLHAAGTLTVPTTEEAFVKAKGAVPVVVAKFGAEWCAPCKRLKPTLQAVCAYGVDVIDVEIDANDELTEFAGKNNVKLLPTLVIFANGKEVGRLVGGGKEADLLEGLVGANAYAAL
jgi:thioredoxin 1